RCSSSWRGSHRRPAVRRRAAWRAPTTDYCGDHIGLSVPVRQQIVLMNSIMAPEKRTAPACGRRRRSRTITVATSLCDGGRGVGGAIVLQRQGVDRAEVDVLPDDARIAGIGPFDLEIPLAAFVGVVELDVDALAVGHNLAEFVVGPVRVAGV